MRHLTHPFLRSIVYVVSLHLICLLFLTLCRIVLALSNIPIDGLDMGLLIHSLAIGVKFDNLIASYISTLPWLVLPLTALILNARTSVAQVMPYMVKSAAWYYGIIYTPLIFLHIANARYFHFFDNHFNIGIIEWFGFVNETAGLVFDDKTNYIFLFIALIFITLFLFTISFLSRRFSRDWQPVPGNVKHYATMSAVSLLLWGVCFCGMRGSFQRYPLRVSFAYFGNHPFYNKLGVNPLFNIIKSAEYGRVGIPKVLQAIDEKDAIAYVQRTLDIEPIDSLRPLVREGVVQQQVTGKPNVVLIFMESMTSYNLERQGNGEWLTPYLRQLREKSIYFSNAYSTSIHTNNGIVGVHYGFLPNFAKPSMNVNAERYTGLPYYMQKAGYRTLCFVTGNPQYDNMNSFWRDNSIEEIYSLYDYSADKAVNRFGVQDDYMFEWGLNKLNEISVSGQPFFASFLTVSNHAPLVVPEAYVQRAPTQDEQIIAFADDAIRQFMETAEQTAWGKNTVFVLVADHGTPLPSPYDMCLPYNSIPIYICSPQLTPQEITTPISQIDIWETVLSLLGIPYSNNCLGIDALNQTREYAFFVSDTHLGASDGEYFYCFNMQSQTDFLYRIGSGDNLIDSYPDRAARMREYAQKMQRVNLLIIDNHWTEPCE